MEDFEKKVVKDVLVEKVNLTRATWKEAIELKRILDEDIINKFPRIVVDISECEFMDSTFLGALVVSQKKVSKSGSEIKLVEPASVMQTLMEKSGTLKIFDTYPTLNDAVESFNLDFSKIENIHPL
jgi:anti-anti-sigma factor